MRLTAYFLKRTLTPRRLRITEIVKTITTSMEEKHV